MKNCRRAPSAVCPDVGVVSTLGAVIALAVFGVAALTSLDITAAVFYGVVVLLVASAGNRPATIIAAWGCVALTLLGFAISHNGAYTSGALARCAVSLLAIAITSILALRNLAATTLLHEQVELLKLAQDALARSTAELAHATRITLLGELAASVAHEVTQPIAAIVTCGGAALRWLNRPAPEIDEAAQSVTQMIRDAKRADEVIQRIRSMAKKRDSLPVAVELNAIVGESIELVRFELERHRIELNIDLAMPPPTACCDRVQLQQVLINLIMNSIQAMADVTGPRKLRIATRPFEGAHVQVIVQDSGTGISEENGGRLFNTFFTTKAEGMGMGLSICRSIVEAHGGRIWAESPAAGGAVLQFILPVGEGRCHEQ
ncbi:sensor histidine kinase [Paraburkholderia sp. BL23I1N1]|uniref:sensor histidine kinase n=1 Tax=Paraburkholderia sp. BL23I1N1 TaxID=1938802 RepID=UPI000E740AEF|nr:ATP-binding protein [Paraburkholderia sp. BL23I1N1]